MALADGLQFYLTGNPEDGFVDAASGVEPSAGTPNLSEIDGFGGITRGGSADSVWTVPGLLPGDCDYTIAFWVWETSTGNNNPLFDFAGVLGLWHQGGGANDIKGYWRNSGGGREYGPTCSSNVDGAWKFGAITYQGDRTPRNIGYRNGGTTGSTDSSARAATTAETVRMRNGGFRWRGLGIWSRALSSAELLQLYDGGNPGYSYANFAPQEPTTDPTIPVWDGGAFVRKPLGVWNGSSWVYRPTQRWNGTEWVDV